MFGLKPKSNVDKWVDAQSEAERYLACAVEAERFGQHSEAKRHYEKAVKAEQEAKRYEQ